MKLATVSFSALLFLASTPAWADVITPQETACTGKSAGAACSVEDAGSEDVTGTCVSVTRPEGNPADDASVTELVCEAGDGGTTTKDSGAAPADASAPSEDTGTAVGDSDIVAHGGQGQGQGQGSGGGCSVTPGSPWQTLAPWLVAGLVPLALRRRRRAS